MDASAALPRDAAASGARLPAWFWIGLLFLCGLVPALANSAVYHGDERFYTDAALAMQRDGELVPRYADGRARLNKPLLAYGAIVASHALFGVGLLQSRLPFAVAGALLVMLSGALAARLSREPRAGTLAALITACNPDVLTLSARSTPDILVCAAALLALDGAARILWEGRRGALHFWLGCGLATAAKGLWGPLLIAFVWLGACARPELRARLRGFLRPGPLFLGLALGAAGVAPLFLAGADEVLAQGGEDQLRGALSAAGALRNLIEYLPSLAIHLLPWTLLLALAASVADGRAALAEALRSPLVRTALCFWGVLVAVFVFGSARRVRYLAASFAPAAIALGVVLSALTAQARSARLVRSACAALSALCTLALLASALGLSRVQPWPALMVGVLAGASLCLGFRLVRRPAPDAPVPCAASVLCAALAFVGLVRPALAYSPLGEIAARVQGSALGLVELEDSLGSRLRLLSGGRLEPVALDAASAGGPRFVLAAAPAAAAWSARGYGTVAEFDALGGPRREDLLRWWRGAGGALRRGAAEERLVLLEAAER